MDRVNIEYENSMNDKFSKIEPNLCKKMIDCIVKPILLKNKTFKTKRLRNTLAKVILVIIFHKFFIEIVRGYY